MNEYLSHNYFFYGISFFTFARQTLLPTTRLNIFQDEKLTELRTICH